VLRAGVQRPQRALARLPGNVDTGIGTTTQLPVFYRFSR